MVGSKQVAGCLVFAGDKVKQLDLMPHAANQTLQHLPQTADVSDDGYFLLVSVLVSQVCDLCWCHAILTKAYGSKFSLIVALHVQVDFR